MKKSIYITGPLPQGKNGLTSRANYVQRKKYNQVFDYLSKINNQNGYIDLNNLSPNIYKTHNGEPINISESTFKDAGEDVYAINFVVDAFNELKEICKNSSEIKNEKFKNLKAKKSWSSLHEAYHKHMIFFLDEFVKHLNKTHKDKNIDSFESFILYYVKFLDNVVYKIPFIKSSYFLSKEYPTRNTGFIIDIELDNADDDNKKFKDFLTNYEYNEFFKLCNTTNFLIDKSCPWRLVYDVFSEQSENYISNYNDTNGNPLNTSTLIENYFYKTKDFDLENLKNYMIIGYNTFVDLKPTLHKPSLTTYNDKQILLTNSVKREKISVEQVTAKYSDVFWFNIYCHLSFVENKLNLSHEQYRAYLRNLNEVFSLNGLNIALQELKKITNNTSKNTTRGEYNFTLPSFS